MTSDKCSHCPLRVACERACPGQRNTRVCQNADPASPTHIPAIIEKIRSHLERPPSESAPPGRPTPAEVREKIARVQACPHWQSASDCGCGKNRCLIGRGDRGRVAYSDCYDCPDLPRKSP